MNWKLAGDIAYSSVAFITALFVIIYMLIAPWYRTQAGRNIVGVMGSLGILMIYFGWSIWNGGVPPGLYPMRFLLFVLLGYFMLRRLIIMVSGQIIVPFLRRRRANVQLEDTREVHRDGPSDRGDGSRDGVPGGGERRG